MEDLNLQNEQNEVKPEIKEEVKEEVKATTPTGFYLANVPTNYNTVIALGDKEVPINKLLVDMANHLKEQTGFKLSE